MGLHCLIWLILVSAWPSWPGPFKQFVCPWPSPTWPSLFIFFGRTWPVLLNLHHVDFHYHFSKSVVSDLTIDLWCEPVSIEASQMPIYSSYLNIWKLNQLDQFSPAQPGLLVFQLSPAQLIWLSQFLGPARPGTWSPHTCTSLKSTEGIFNDINIAVGFSCGQRYVYSKLRFTSCSKSNNSQFV